MFTSSKPILFRIAATLLPLAVLAILELVLRGIGAAGDATRPFRTVDGHEEYLMLNPNYTSRYFGTFSPAVAFDPFRAEKPKETFRVFAFGGSSTAGFPYTGYAFPSLLQSRLEYFLPDLRSETVNLALTATNSYTIRDLSGDVVQLEPDAVIIYAGHNEYYGAFGAGTTVNRLGNMRWLKRLVLGLKRSALYTLLERGIARVRPRRDVVGRTMMAEAVGTASIPAGGDVYREGIVQFEENMAATVRRFCDAGVPVYIGTVASNLEGQAPLGLDEAAAAAFLAGRAAVERGDTVEARARFEEARDLDDLRFRASSEINDVIRGVVESSCATLVDTEAALRRASPSELEGHTLFADHLHPNVIGHDRMAETFYAALLDHPRLVERPRLAAEPVDRAVDVLGAAVAELRIGRLMLGQPFARGYTPEQEADRFRSFVSEFARRGAIESVAARTELGDMQDAEGFAQAVEWARTRGDTLGVLRMYRSRLRGRPFAEEDARWALLFGLGGSGTTPLIRDLSSMRVNRAEGPLWLQALAYSMLDLGHIEDAGRLLAFAELQGDTSLARRHNQIGLAIARGDEAEAREQLEQLASRVGLQTALSTWSVDLPFGKLLGLEVDDFASLVWLGNNHRRGGRLQDAISAYESASRIRPGDLALRNNIATAFLQLGDTTAAARRYRSIIAEDSTFVEAWINLALYYARSGQADRANRAIRRAVMLAPDHPMLQRLGASAGR